MTTALEKSFKARIRNLAREKRVDPAALWQQLVLERFLVRISRSRFASQFVLKGGVLLSTYVSLNRRTQDLNFSLKTIDRTPEDLHEILAEIAAIPVRDGFSFDQAIVTPLSHPHMKVPGLRARMRATFGRTRFPVSLDFGSGDLVEPIDRSIDLIASSKEALFEDSVTVTCYPPEFIFAEKLETIIHRGENNSRMKDYHDLLIMTDQLTFSSDHLYQVILSVFEHRQTELHLPLVFSGPSLEGFQNLWDAHLRTLTQGHGMPTRFVETLARINQWLERYLPVGGWF